MRLVVFEDGQSDHFLPVSWLRAVFELRTGATTLVRKIERAAGMSAHALLVRDYLEPTVRARHPGAAVNNLSECRGSDTLFVNGRVCGLGFTPPDRPVALWRGDRLAVWRTGDDITRISSYADLEAAARKGPAGDYTGQWFEYIWDLVLKNPEHITADFKLARKHGIECALHEPDCVFGYKDQVCIAESVRIHPFVCIDTHNGPVTIEEGCEIHPFTRIEGPAWIGPKTIILGAKVREGCSIGPMCRVGGEVEESIIHGYSNKYHDGFLGHAYVGEWVNLGALTSNSDLKNDYTTVSVMMGHDTIDTGSTKVGAMIGDHVKTSIGTLLNTGAFVGTGSVLVATGAPLPKYIPPFAWFLNGFIGKGFGLNALISTARTAMSRRKVEMTADDEALLRRIFELTAEDRLKYVARGRRAMLGK